jgi:hypothetical protein
MSEPNEYLTWSPAKRRAFRNAPIIIRRFSKINTHIGGRYFDGYERAASRWYVDPVEAKLRAAKIW